MPERDKYLGDLEMSWMHMFQSIHSTYMAVYVLKDYTFSNHQSPSTSKLMSSISILLQIIKPTLWSLSVGVSCHGAIS